MTAVIINGILTQLLIAGAFMLPGLFLYLIIVFLSRKEEREHKQEEEFRKLNRQWQQRLEEQAHQLNERIERLERSRVGSSVPQPDLTDITIL